MPETLSLLDTTEPVCCAPLAVGVMNPDGALAVALRLKALADPIRVRLLSMLLADAPLDRTGSRRPPPTALQTWGLGRLGRPRG